MAAILRVVRNNRAYARRKNPFKKEPYLKQNTNQLSTSSQDIPAVEISEEERTVIQIKILKERKRERNRFIILLLFALPILGSIGYYVVNGLQDRYGDFYTSSSETTAISKATYDKYQFYLKDGDNWLAQKKYHNAVFQYSKAAELIKNDYASLYRLALGYSYQCQNQLKNCERGEAILERLEKDFPNSEEVKALRNFY